MGNLFCSNQNTPSPNQRSSMTKFHNNISFNNFLLVWNNYAKRKTIFPQAKRSSISIAFLPAF